MKSILLLCPLREPPDLDLRVRVLPELRRARAAHFLRGEDRLRCLLAGLLLRRALVDAGLPPDLDARLADGPCGRPEWPAELGLYLSLAHSGDWVAVALHSGPIGVDVEAITPLDSEVEALSFTPAEQAWIRDQPVLERPAAFHRLWTLKESLLKALGTGLSLDPRRLEFHRDPGGAWHVQLRPGLPGPSLAGWHFREEPPDDVHALALCWAGPEMPSAERLAAP